MVDPPSCRLMARAPRRDVVDQTEEGGPRTPAAERWRKTGTKTGSGSSGRGTSRRGGAAARPRAAATRSAVRSSQRMANAARKPIVICAATPMGRMPERISSGSGDPAVSAFEHLQGDERADLEPHDAAGEPEETPGGRRVRQLRDEHGGHRGQGDHQRDVVRQPEVRVTGLVQDRGPRAGDRRHHQVRQPVAGEHAAHGDAHRGEPASSAHAVDCRLAPGQRRSRP